VYLESDIIAIFTEVSRTAKQITGIHQHAAAGNYTTCLTNIDAYFYHAQAVLVFDKGAMDDDAVSWHAHRLLPGWMRLRLG
jgi:hypothetical protein